MARKFHSPDSARAAAETAATQLRMATVQLAGLRLQPRARKIQSIRRRLLITMVPGSAQPVIIRQLAQNMGTGVSETQPAQSPRV